MTIIEQQNANRIRIVQFLRTELPAKRFMLSSIFDKSELLKEEVPNLDNNECGTVGCVIGWTPKAHPDQVKFVPKKSFNGKVINMDVQSIDLPENVHEAWPDLAMKLYGVHYSIARNLFNAHPNYSAYQEPVPGFECDDNSTPAQVALRLETYFNNHPLTEPLVNETKENAS